MLAAGLETIAVPASRPSRSRIRIPSSGTPTVSSRPMPSPANHSADVSAGSRSSIMSGSDGSTSPRSSSSPPGVSASTHPPTAAKLERNSAAVVVPKRHCCVAARNSGPKKRSPIGQCASSVLPPKVRRSSSVT